MAHIPLSESFGGALDAVHEPEAQRTLGTAYWAFLVTLFVCMCVISAGFGVWEFLRPLGEPSGSVSVGTAKTLSRNDLQKILEGFSARATEYEAKLVAPAPLKDPS